MRFSAPGNAELPVRGLDKCERVRNYSHVSVDWERLGSAVFRRRVDLGIRSRRALAVAAEVGKRTVDSLETGHTVSLQSLYKIEKPLAWPGLADAVRSGTQPRPPSDERPNDMAPQVSDVLPDLSHLSANDRREFIRHAFDVLPMVKEHFPGLYDEAWDQVIELVRLYGGQGDVAERGRRSR